MKISELIEKLQELQNVHGDMDVAYVARDAEYFDVRLEHSAMFETVLIMKED